MHDLIREAYSNFFSQMKTFSSKVILFVVAIIIAIAMALASFWYGYEKEMVAHVFIISFTTSFLLGLVSLFIIYMNIDVVLHNIKLFRHKRDSGLVKNINYNSEMAQLNTEILAWANDRKNEIERLKQLEIYRKEFLGNVSHELKTPVFSIQGYISTLLDGGLEDATINRTYLERSEKSVERMIAMIDDLEAITQLESGVLELDEDSFDIAKLANEVVKALELRATEKGIMLQVISGGSPRIVVGDKFRIRQVLENLIVNSIKYGKEYGLTKVSFYDTGSTYTIEIVDNGIGISKEHLPRLFERFYRVDKSRSRDQGGIGLGLSIVKHIVEAHHQSLNVTSTYGKGTTFTFTLNKGH